MRRDIAIVEGTSPHELVVLRDRAASEVDGKMYDYAVYLNPGTQETAALLGRCISSEGVRGFVSQTGDVLVWDGYINDHHGTEHALRSDGITLTCDIRFSMSRDEFIQGIIRPYEQDLEGADHRGKPTGSTDPQRLSWLTDSPHIQRMFGGRTPTVHHLDRPATP